MESSTRPQTVCEFCKAVVRNDRLSHHIRKVHKSHVLSCPICKADIARPALRKHIQRVHETNRNYIKDFYCYKRTIKVYGNDECKPLKDLDNEYHDSELMILNSLPENRLDHSSSPPKSTVYEIIEAGKDTQASSQNKPETDSIVVITQTRTIALRNPSKEELRHWLREYKRWI